MVEEPADLGARKVRIDDQPCSLPKQRFEPVGFQPVANLRARAALPHYGGIDWRACRTVPDNCRLALIGDTDANYLLAAGACPRQHLSTNGYSCREDLVWIVLDPSWPRVTLSNFPIHGGHQLAISVEQQRGRAGRALVERQDVRHAVAGAPACVKRRIGSISRRYASHCRLRSAASQPSSAPTCSAIVSRQSSA